MISKFILMFAFMITLVLCIAILRNTKGKSILSWHILVFISIQPSLLFIEYFMNNDSLSIFARFDETVVDRMINSFALADMIGVIYMIFMFNLSRKKSKKENTATTGITDSLSPYWIGVMISIAGLVWYINSSKGQLILSYGLNSLGDYKDYYRLRYESGLQRSSLIEQYIYVFSVATFTPLLTLYSLQKFLRNYDKKWMFLWFMNLGFWVLASLIAYAKSPIIAVVISNIVMVVFDLQRRRVNKGLGVIFSAMGVVLCMYAIYSVISIAYGSNNAYDIMGMVLDRFVSIPISTAYNHFYVFPDISQYTYYSNSRSLNIILGGGYFVNTGGLQTFEIASYYLFGVAFNMNTGFVAAGWAELGYIGVIQVSIVVFGVLLFWDVWFYRENRYATIDVLLIFFIGRLWQINNGDMMFLLIPGGFVFAPLIYLFLDQGAVRLPASSKTVKLADTAEIIVN